MIRSSSTLPRLEGLGDPPVEQPVETYFHGRSAMYGGSNWDAHRYWIPQAASWVKLERLGNMVTAYVSPDGDDLGGPGGGAIDNLRATWYVGLRDIHGQPDTTMHRDLQQREHHRGTGGAARHCHPPRRRDPSFAGRRRRPAPLETNPSGRAQLHRETCHHQRRDLI